MSKIVMTKEYIDPLTKEKTYYVFAQFDTGDIEPVKLCKSFEEKVDFERKLLGEQEKQSDEI